MEPLMNDQNRFSSFNSLRFTPIFRCVTPCNFVVPIQKAWLSRMSEHLPLAPSGPSSASTAQCPVRPPEAPKLGLCLVWEQGSAVGQ